MVHCMAVDCNNDSKWTKGISFHGLPKDDKLKNEWLAKINRVNPTISKNSVLCSEHFTPNCFERNLKAELVGVRGKAKLKQGAVPTIFSHRPAMKKRRVSSERRQEKKAKEEVRIVFIQILE